MRVLAQWAWVIVLGTALSLSWWSLDALARHYGMPAVLAGMVSATFDGAALVAAELAIRRAQAADSAAPVKLLMLTAVGLSAWLNFEHGALLGYPQAVRVLFAAPPVIAGALFELQLKSLHRARLRELGQIAAPLPRFGTMVWVMHPFGALRRMSQISGSRLQSVPLDVMDWESEQVPAVPARVVVAQAIGASPVRELSASPLNGTASTEPVAHAAPAHNTAAARASRHDDEFYATQLRELITANGGKVPSAREVARKLSIGQDRARRLVRHVS